MNIILHDYDNHLAFAPLTLTRPVGKLRTGMWTNDERWKYYCPDARITFRTEAYLSGKFPAKVLEDNYWVNAAVIPTESLVEKVQQLAIGASLYLNDVFIAHRGRECNPSKTFSFHSDDLIVLQNRWDLYGKNEEILKADFASYTSHKKSAPLSPTNTLIGDKSQLFIEEGAIVECAVLNVNSGPIYIGKDAEIMEGSVGRGGLAMAEHSVLKMATKVYGATSLGPHCKIGGEVGNVIFHGYSNKGHDGFVGNSVVGEWCNFRADTNCSNLKNNYGNVKTYNYVTREVEQTDVQFMGVTMGDFSKTSINTMLNTATVVGVSANIFTDGFPPKFVENFSWGGQENSPTFDFDKAIEAANKMMERRGKKVTEEDRAILLYLFNKYNK